MKVVKKPCWCYTGEITLCCDCDREYILIDVRTYRKFNQKLRKIITQIKRRERSERLPVSDLERKLS